VADILSLLPSEQPVQLLRPDGAVAEQSELACDLDDERIADLYQHMLVTRSLDREAVNLQRQGQVGAYPPNLGQEAAQVGSAFALGDQDWVFPAYRELGAAVVRGVPPSALLHPFRGTWHGVHDPREHRYGLLCLPIATQLLHATGFAMGARLDGDPIVVMTYLGDGASSEGDAHEAMNVASVFKAPIVFVIQNNQYAISVPVQQQYAAPSLAHRGVGYGMPGVLVDGNDVLACYAASRVAVERARQGDGPTLIEMRTYRMDGHSTADDWSRYRTGGETADWERRDPLARVRAFLMARGTLDEEREAAIEATATEAAARLRAEIWDAPAPEPTEMFAHVYASPPPVLAGQHAQLDAELAARAAVSR
jgi:pyruvate dehydrogenase E1 component alpha subunit